MHSDPATTPDILELLLREVRELRAEVKALRAEVRELRGGTVVEPVKVHDATPISSWAAAADLLGVSVDTLRRRRTTRGDKTKPWWASADACKAWWAGLIAPKVKTKPPRTRNPQRHTTPVRFGDLV